MRVPMLLLAALKIFDCTSFSASSISCAVGVDFDLFAFACCLLVGLLYVVVDIERSRTKQHNVNDDDSKNNKKTTE